MELRELRIERLPGLEKPFAVTGTSGLNLVLGPNGSGKSSICRAALGLLWPGADDRGILSATWSDQGRTWHAARAGSPVVVWQRDGQESPPPDLPLADQAGSFRLGVLDLLKLTADATDGDLARSIRNQMAGGYDLGALLERHPDSKTGVGTGGKALKTARERVDILRREQSDLADQESKLAGLRRNLDAAREASRRAEALAAALAVVQARAEAEDAASALEARYRPSMARIQDSDYDDLQGLRSHQRNFTRDRDEAARAIARAEASLASTRLPDGGPDAAVMAEMRNLHAEARTLETERDHAAADVAATRAALATALSQVSPWGDPEPGAPLDAAALRRAGQELQEQMVRRAERDGLDRLLNRPDLQDAEPDALAAEELAAARRALSAWLDAGVERTLPWPGLLAVAGLLAGAVGLSFWNGGWPGWMLLGLAAFVLAGVGVPWLARSRSRRARSAFEATGVAGPSRWNAEAVTARIQELGDAEPRAALATLRRQFRQDLTAGRDQASAALDAQAGPRDAGQATDAAERLLRSSAYHQALRDHDAAVSRHDHLAAKLEEQLAAVVSRLKPWLDDAPDSLAAMSAILDDLDRRRDTHREETLALDAARTRRDDLDARRLKTEDEIAALMADRGLKPDDDAILNAHVTQLAGYREFVKIVTDKTTARTLAEAALGRLAPDVRDAAQETLVRSAAELADELETARIEAGAVEELNEQIIKIETRLVDARRGTALDAAVAAQESAEQDLTAIRDARRDTALRRLLLERVRGQHRRASEPAVLARARSLFSDFTDGRYELIVADTDQDTFRAVVTATGVGLSLGQLSDGTRAQLLLAVRLAYLQETERGVRLPLFLDESLTASDAARFEAIGRSVIRLIRDEGRQVFYLTCDPADIEAWQRLLTREGLPEASVIDLASVRRLAAAAPSGRLRPPRRPSVPAPDPGEDAAAYGARIDAPALETRSADAAHPFHLLRDRLPLLHDLLTSGVDTVGQIEPLAATLAADGKLAPEDRRRLAARRRALAAFLAAFGTGRGRIVPAGAITAESGITSGKLSEIEDILVAEHGDAARLVDALAHKRVKGLRTNMREELTDWLEQEGYLDPRPVLERARVELDVKVSARADLEAGMLDLATLDALIGAWWTAAGGEVG